MIPGEDLETVRSRSASPGRTAGRTWGPVGNGSRLEHGGNGGPTTMPEITIGGWSVSSQSWPHGMVRVDGDQVLALLFEFPYAITFTVAPAASGDAVGGIDARHRQGQAGRGDRDVRLEHDGLVRVVGHQQRERVRLGRGRDRCSRRRPRATVRLQFPGSLQAVPTSHARRATGGGVGRSGEDEWDGRNRPAAPLAIVRREWRLCSRSSDMSAPLLVVEVLAQDSTR